ncbi:MAG TPA: glycosyltransferase [Gemmatimonadaceae bacterium]|nr:glycosyltransferase [Gemmatimonadaceae bacterium]
MLVSDAAVADTGAAIDAAAVAERPLVAIYREVMMNYNEVYVRTEGEALRRYRALYVGSHRLDQVELPADRTLTLREMYRPVDRVLDPILTRAGYRLRALGPLAPLGDALARGGLAGRASEYAFRVHGVSPALVRALRVRRPVLLHAFTGVSGAHALPLARRLGIPLMVTFGGYEATATDEELYQWKVRGRVFLRRREAMKHEVRLILTVSDFLRRQVIARGWPVEKVVVQYRGIDTDLFTPEGRPSLAERAPVVFHAGRLMEAKGTIYLVRAMRRVQDAVPDAELVVAGSGAQGPVLEREARALGVRVRFLGRVAPEVVRACHAEAQVYCMPSVRSSTGQREGLSNALLEAMSSGLPVVASDSGGIPEAVGDAGVLVPEQDVAGLAARILALLGDPELRQRMGAAARQRVVTHFDLHRQVARLEELYDRVRRSS